MTDRTKELADEYAKIAGLLDHGVDGLAVRSLLHIVVNQHQRIDALEDMLRKEIARIDSFLMHK